MWKTFCMEAICERSPRWRPQRRRPPAGPDIKSQFWVGLYIANVENVENILYGSNLCKHTSMAPSTPAPTRWSWHEFFFIVFLHMCKMWKIIWIKAVIAHSPRWRPESASGWSILTGEGADGSSQPRVELTPGGQFPKFWRGLSCQSVLPGKQTNIRHVEQQLWPTTFWESTW